LVSGATTFGDEAWLVSGAANGLSLAAVAPRGEGAGYEVVKVETPATEPVEAAPLVA